MNPTVSNWVGEVLVRTWDVLGEMAPYLLFGFAVAGFLAVAIRPGFVERHLGGRGWREIFKATLVGVPMPLCSCSVIPVTASLRRHGAGKGATVAFLASTPETGVDSIAATYGLLGGAFTLARVLAAFAIGLLAGGAVEALDPAPAAGPAHPEDCPTCSARRGPRWLRALRHGFVDLPREIGGSLLAGLLIAGLLGALVPPQYFADRLGHHPAAFLMVLALAIPMYVCSTGSIPVAFALLQAGLSPGAALVFLIAGPATNAATIATLWKLMGRRTAVIYVAAIAAGALGAGWLFDQFPAATQWAGPMACHAPGSGAGRTLAATALLLVLIGAQAGRWAARFRRRPAPCACTH